MLEIPTNQNVRGTKPQNPLTNPRIQKLPHSFQLLLKVPEVHYKPNVPGHASIRGPLLKVQEYLEMP